MVDLGWLQSAWATIAREVANSPTTTVLTLLSVLFGLTSVVLWFKSSRSKKPCYFMHSFNVVTDFSNSFESLKILRDDRPIENLTLTTFIFWNAGKDVIKMDDVPTSDPIRLKLRDGCQLLEEPIVAVEVNPANAVQLATSEDGSEVTVHFIYFGTNEGFATQIVHDGRSGQDVQLLGTIMNHSIKNVRERAKWSWLRLVGAAMIGSSVIAVLLFVFYGKYLRHLTLQTHWDILLLLMLVSLLAGIGPGALAAYLYYKIWEPRILPSKLNVLDNNL